MLNSLPRRILIGAVLALCAAAPVLSQQAWAAQPDGMRVVTILGDSLTAGYGLNRAEAIPAQLQDALTRMGLKVVVRPAGVSGDTTADGLARVDFSVRDDTDLAVVMLGGNDLLQGVDPKTVRANLTAIAQRLKARHLRAMLVGVAAPPQIGAGYAKEFDAVVPEVAKAQGLPALADLLGKVRADPGLIQPDGVHPNAKGVKIVVMRLAPAVAAALNSKR